MSRHRDIRNLNIHDQLDDDALSDGGEEVLDEEQQAAMDNGLIQVREILGDEGVSGVSDAAIQDALWHLYFDVEQTVHWLIEEEERKAIARERRDKSLPPLPDDNEALYGRPPNEMAPGERPRVPLIYLAQQRHLERVKETLQQMREEAEEAMEADMDDSLLMSGAPMNGRYLRPMLSRITERSERSEGTVYRPSRHMQPDTASSVTESYGQIIEPTLGIQNRVSMHPNEIPPSPSESAVNHLSYYEPPPSPLSTVSAVYAPRPTSAPSPAPVAPVTPVTEVVEERSVRSSRRSEEGSIRSGHKSEEKSIRSSHRSEEKSIRSSYRSEDKSVRSSHRFEDKSIRSSRRSEDRSSTSSQPLVLPTPPDTASTVSTVPPPVPPKKLSKLSMLASSRASSSSASSFSRDGSTAVRTYSQLRPTSKSLRPASTTAPPSDITMSGSSSIARKAIAAALELERLDISTDESSSISSETTVKMALRTPSPDRSIASTAKARTPSPERSPTASQMSTWDVISDPSVKPSSKMSSGVLIEAPSLSEKAPTHVPSPVRTSTSRSTLSQSSPISPGLSPFRSGTPASPTATVRPPSISSSQPASSKSQSKLALLAQQKARKSTSGGEKGTLRELLDMPVPRQGPVLPKPHTEYLTPIANGPTVTTAITTSYESFYSLTDPTRPKQLRTMKTVSLDDATAKTKATSKLASKSRKAHEKKDKAEAEYQEMKKKLEREESSPTPSQVSPLFRPPTHHKSRADPSAFASLLVDDPPLTSKEAEKEERRRRRREKEKEKAAKAADADLDKEERRRRRRERRAVPEPPIGMQANGGFAFDVPSPDDIVNNARKGTSLAKHRSSVPAHA